MEPWRAVDAHNGALEGFKVAVCLNYISDGKKLVFEDLKSFGSLTVTAKYCSIKIRYQHFKTIFCISLLLS